jgi:hypothetical protein
MGSDRNGICITLVMYIIVIWIEIIIIAIQGYYYYYYWRNDEWLKDISLFPLHIY